MKKGFIFTIALAMVLGAGVAVGAHQGQVAKEAAATDTTVYCKMEYSWWTDSGAAIGAYYWKDGESSPLSYPGARMTLAPNETNVWKYTIPSGYDKVIFTRMNPSDEGDQDWGAKTKDLSVPTDSNVLYTISSSSAAWGDPGVDGSWGTYTEKPNDRISTVSIDLGSLPEIEGFNYPEIYYYDSSDVSTKTYEPLHQLSGSIYTINFVYNHERVINTVGFLFKENSEDKWSNTMSVNFTSDKTAYYFKFNEHWTEGTPWTWDVVNGADFYNGVPRVRGDSISDTSFSADYENKAYTVQFTTSSDEDSFQIFYGAWNLGALRSGFASAYCSNHNLNNFIIKVAGTYKITAYNNYSDEGIFEIRKVGSEVSYIYYVTNSNEPTNDYIYSWGGSKQFGNDFPGTKVTAAASVKEVTGNGVLHFQGDVTPKLIYKIPVVIGYPTTGDDMFMFNNGTEEYKSPERVFVPHAAYWWDGPANMDASAAIEFLVAAEAVRNAAEDYSVCNVSPEDAAEIVEAYNALSSDVRQYFVDITTVYTWKDINKKEEEKTLVSYRAVVERLAKIAGGAVEVVGTSRPTSNNSLDSNTMIIVISVIALVSVSSVAILLVIKKRKHN